MNRQTHRWFARGAVLWAAAGLAGCATAPTHQDAMTFIKAKDHVASGSTYRLSPPDIIRIHSPQAPEVDSTVPVRADGTIHLRLLGEVRIAGLTGREAAAKIQKELSVFYREPAVDITVERPTGRVFYLFGEVGVRGSTGFGGGGDRGGAVRPLTGRDTLMDVLTTYPPSQNAWLSQIKVIRPDDAHPDHNQEIVVDFRKMISTGDLRQNILLQEGDIVYVPPTPMAWVGYRIREILQPVAPIMLAYRTPAQVISANDVYTDDNDDGDDGSSNLLGRLQVR